jgi:hypothetical protein
MLLKVFSSDTIFSQIAGGGAANAELRDDPREAKGRAPPPLIQNFF